MPIFEYRCEACAHQFEKMVFPNLTPGEGDPPHGCPYCGGEKITRLISSGSFRPHGIPRGKGGFTPPKCHRKDG